MDYNNLCMGCMREKQNTGICSLCGYDETNAQVDPRCLPPGTVLNGQYLLGKALGQGGFGITYIAYDLNLDTKVAIKEYMPEGLAARTVGVRTVSVYTNEKKVSFEYGLDKFLEEAKMVAKFNDVPSVVSVRNFFKENGTAYFVMDFVEGMNLGSYLKSKGGKLPVEECLRIIYQVMDALSVVHKSNLLHRDISPDNIYLTDKGAVKILDFGAARYAINEQSKSLAVILKPGYAPEEQYRSKGHQGPWTDVYAVGATLYRMLTGQIPPESMDRLHGDEILMPSQRGISIPRHVEAAIMKALAIKSENRFQNVDDFKKALEGNLAVSTASNNSGSPVIKPPVQHQDELSYIQLQDIYIRTGPTDWIPEKNKEVFRRNTFGHTYPTALVIIFHFLTFGIFSIFNMGLKHSRLPLIKGDDFRAGKAIGYLFIPFFNIYWIFKFWLRLADRVNLQFRLRNRPDPVPKGLLLAALIMNFIPYINFISMFIFMPICLGIIQSSCNYLARENGRYEQSKGTAGLAVSFAALALICLFTLIGIAAMPESSIDNISENTYFEEDDQTDASIAAPQLTSKSEAVATEPTTQNETTVTDPGAVQSEATPAEPTPTPDVTEDKEHKLLKSSDGKFEMMIPTYWVTMKNINPDSQLQAGNTLKGEYAVSTSESNAALGVSLEDYYSLREQLLRKEMPDLEITNKETLYVNNLNAIRFEGTGSSSNIGLSFMATVLENDEYLTFIMTWTLPDNYYNIRDEFTRVHDSFKIN